MSKQEKHHAAKASPVKSEAKHSYHTEFPAADGKRPYSETINKPVKEVAAILGNLKKLPEFLEHLEKVDSEKGESSVWYFRKGSADAQTVSFKTKVKGHSFSFSSEDNLGFAFEMRMELVPAPGDRGTIVRMKPAFESGAAAKAAKVEALFGEDPALHTKKTLQRFKAYCETGHVPTIEGQPSGREE